MRALIMALSWFILAFGASAQAKEITRGGFALHGSWAYHPAPLQPVPLAPVGAPIAPAELSGCVGMGAILIPESVERRGRQGRRRVYLPSHERFILRAFDVCSGLGAGNHHNSISVFHVGYGGQWGGRALYVMASGEGGFTYQEQSIGPATVGAAGLGLRPRAAVGLQVGPANVEIGPTLRALVPVVVEAHNAAAVRGLTVSGALEVEVTFGAGVGPKRW